jgi:hypothetical protein
VLYLSCWRTPADKDASAAVEAQSTLCALDQHLSHREPRVVGVVVNEAVAVDDCSHGTAHVRSYGYLLLTVVGGGGGGGGVCVCGGRGGGGGT